MTKSNIDITEETIGIYILSSHENYFSNLLQILETHSGDVVIFSKQESLEKVSDKISNSNSYSWVLKSESEPLESFLSRASSIWNSTVDILVSFPFYCGIYDLNRYFKLEYECTHLQMIYNVNMWTGTELRYTSRFYRYLNNILRMRMLSRVDGILVEYSPIKSYLESISTTDNVEFFTPIVFEGTNPTSSEHRVTVPGHIEPARRNYEFFLDAVEEHLQEYKNNLEIYLLGSPSGPKGEAVVDRCDRLAESGWKVRYHRGWVPVEQFEQVLKRSELIVSPMRKFISGNTVKERYGLSKGSGSFGDAIRYGKPLALPDHYEIPPEVGSVVRPYATESSLAEIIRSTSKLGGLSGSGIEQLEQNFSLESQRKRFYDIISQFHC